MLYFQKSMGLLVGLPCSRPQMRVTNNKNNMNNNNTTNNNNTYTCYVLCVNLHICTYSKILYLI